MSKMEYRVYFHNVGEVVKMSKIFSMMNMSTTNFYRFLKSEEYDWCMSEELLESIKQTTERVVLEKLT